MLIDIQRTHRRLGKIRMGDRAEQGNPRKLTAWRVTTPSLDLAQAVAAAYGGQAVEWGDAPDQGRQWQVYTDADTLAVIVPPVAEGSEDDAVFSQWYEKWTGGGCERRCPGTGGTEQISGGPCVCPVDQEVRAADAAKGRACRMTTRLSVLLPEIPDIGTWMVESHGYYAAVELGGAIQLIRQAAAGQMVPARLRMDQRTVKRDGQTNRFVVPVLELVTVTPGQLMAGTAAVAQVEAGGPSRPSLPPAGGDGSGGPSSPDRPQPALPGEAPPEPAAEGGLPQWQKRLHARTAEVVGGDHALQDEVRHLLVRKATDGRTSSSSDLTPEEGDAYDEYLNQIAAGTLEIWPRSSGGYEIRASGGQGAVSAPESAADGFPPGWQDLAGPDKTRALKKARLIAESEGVTPPTSFAAILADLAAKVVAE